MSDLTALRSHFIGEVFTEESPGYDAARRPLDPGFQHVFPRVVLRCRSRSDVADGSVVNCGHHQAPDLFWSPRGAGCCQFGVVVSLRFGTVCEPLTTRILSTWARRRTPGSTLPGLPLIGTGPDASIPTSPTLHSKTGQAPITPGTTRGSSR